MIPGDAVGLFAGAIVLGAIHGIEPGHGWPVAASYALDQSNKWLYGFAASFVLGVGHLVSSIAMVVAFFFAKSYFELTEVNEPLVVWGVEIGGPVGVIAGVLLIALGIREYFHGHSHSHGGDGHGHGDDHGHSHHGDGHSHDGHDHHDDSHDHEFGHSHDRGGHEHSHNHDDHEHPHDHGHAHDHSHDGDQSHDRDRSHTHDHSHDHGHVHDHHDENRDLLDKIKLAIPFVGGHSHGSAEDATDRGLWGIAGFAFVLGFAHEEEFEIIGLCLGSRYCLELMLVYALAVLVALIALTLLLVAGFERYGERVEGLAEHLPTVSAVVLVALGLGFIFGVV